MAGSLAASTTYDTFRGRSSEREIYHASRPSMAWGKMETSGDLTDTMKPIGAYRIEDALLTIHTFPFQIPPEAQVERWQKQFPGRLFDISEVSHGGFGGLRLEIDGAMIGYAMQLTPVLYRAIKDPEMRADYTIKCVGPMNTLEKYRDEIDHFARSFEWTLPANYDEISR